MAQTTPFELRLQVNGQLVKLATLKPILVDNFPINDLPRCFDIGGNFARGAELEIVRKSRPLDFRVDVPAEVNICNICAYK